METTLTEAVASYDMATANDRMENNGIDATIWTAARMEAQTAFARYCRNLHVRLYLYHKPSCDGFAGRTRIAPDVPGHGWVLSCSDHLPRHITEDALTSWIHAVLRELPILGLGRSELAEEGGVE